MRRQSRGISKFLRVQGSKFSSFSGSGIKLLGKHMGSVMKKYTSLRPLDWQFDHQTSSPHYPQSNGRLKMLSSQQRNYSQRQRQAGKTHILPFLIGAIRHQPALELRQFKDCLGDEQRRYYRRLENCSNPKSWKVLRRS